MHTDLIYCAVRISNIRPAVIHLTDAADDFSEKTNNNRNLHSTVINLFF